MEKRTEIENKTNQAGCEQTMEVVKEMAVLLNKLYKFVEDIYCRNLDEDCYEFHLPDSIEEIREIRNVLRKVNQKVFGKESIDD